ncbi:hypothetical protein GJ496_006480 [Pomphorhynchus laevis]|nr:hypothetical protein GJ496_006480 [Pomphorhynchus laevis]
MSRIATHLTQNRTLKTPNAQWTAALAHLESVSELGYLTQIIIQLYEDPNVPKDSDNRFHVKIQFSPGSSEDCVPEQDHAVNLKLSPAVRNDTAARIQYGIRNAFNVVAY